MVIVSSKETEHSMDLSEERIKNDELELMYYGCCSTQIYLNYRESIDKRLKIQMLEIAKYYDEIKKEDTDLINKRLLEQYKSFWSLAEPSLQKFYDNIQEILALPKDFTLNYLSPEDVSQNLNELKKLEDEIQTLEEKYLCEKFFIHSLTLRKEQIANVCVPLEKQVKLALKLLETYKKQMEKLGILFEKSKEMTQKFLKGVDKKTIFQVLPQDMEEIKENSNSS